MVGQAGVGRVGLGPGRRSRLAAAITTSIVVLAAACFLPSLGNKFLPHWDDGNLLENEIVLGGLTIEGVERAFTTRHMGNWIPLTWISFMADVSAFGFVAWKHRLINIALHAANGALVFTLLRSATGALWPSALTASLFAVHPLRVESVVWIAERKDVLSALFGLLALLEYRRWTAGGRRPALVASTALFVASLLSKPMLVTLPVLLLCVDWWPLGRLNRASWRARVLEKLPLAALSTAVAVITLVTQHRGGAMRSIAVPSRLADAIVGYAEYLRLATLPLGLSPLYPRPDGGSGFAPTATAIVVLLLLSTGVFLARRGLPWLLAGWLWYLVALVPVAGFVPVGNQLMADRYSYLPLLGPSVAAVWTIRACAAGSHSQRRVLGLAGVLIVVLFSAMTLRQEGYWRDELTLFLRVEKLMPPNSAIEYDRGMFRERQGDLASAERHYRQAVALDPDNAEAMVNLGRLLSAAHDQRDAAADLLRTAIRKAPRLASAWNNLGAILWQEGHVGEALKHYQRAVELDPRYVDAHLNLGLALAASAREREALREFEVAAHLDPSSALAHSQLGIGLARAGRFADAVGELAAAAELDPGNAQVREALETAQRLAHRGRLQSDAGPAKH